MKRILSWVAATLLACAIPVAAQVPGGGITSVGPITPNDCALWVSRYQLKDGSCGGGGGVSSFNTRTGAVTLSSGDVTTALGYTPLSPANNLSDLANAGTARTNLGLGTFATQNFATPPAIGGTTPAAGAFTTLSASGAVSGAGFSTYLASPPAIGGTAAAAGSFSALTATVSFTATGLVTLADLANQAANTVLSNATSGSAAPTAFAMPSCSGATSALTWTTSAGFGCNTLSAGGNTTISPASSNTVGDILSMGNTTTTITDSGANITAAAWTTNGIQANVKAATLTDNSSAAGTVAAIYNNVIGGSTIATSVNTVTYTNAASLDVELPVAGTHVTLTNRYTARFGGNVLSSANYYATATSGCGAGQPGFSFVGATSTGISYNGSNTLQFCIGGSAVGLLQAVGLQGAGGGTLTAAGPSATVPDILPVSANTGTGIGDSGGGNNVDLIAQSVDMFRVSNAHAYGVGFATAAANETGYLCYNSGSTPANEIFLDTVVCLVSLRKFKDISGPIDGESALADVMALKPVWGKWKQSTHPTSDTHEQPFLVAEDVEGVDSRLSTYTKDGDLKGWRADGGMQAVMIAAIQEQQREIDELRGYQ